MVKRRKRKKRKNPLVYLIVGLAALELLLMLAVGRKSPQPEATESLPTGMETTGDARLVVNGTVPPPIPQALLDLEARNPETAGFVQGYPGSFSMENVDISEDYIPGEIPHFLQWDKRWGYMAYGGNRPKDLMGLSGCGPTALSMVIVGLTGDTSAHPAAVAQWAADNGYVTQDDGTSWTLMSEGCAHFGLTAYEVPLWEESMLDALDGGSPILCAVGKGDFTQMGHFIVIVSRDEAGNFLVFDPNSNANSQRSWTYQALSPQIRAMWVYEVG